MDYNAASPMGNPPQLGTPIPGTTGGLPAQGGLNVAQNPMAQQITAAMQAHIAEHFGFKYRQLIEQQVGGPIPYVDMDDDEASLPQEYELELSRLVAKASEQLLTQNQAAAAQQQAQQQAEDPIIQMQIKELEIKAAELQRKIAKDTSDTQNERERLLVEKLRVEGQLELEAQKLGVQIAKDKDIANRKEILEGTKIGVDIVKAKDQIKTQKMQIASQLAVAAGNKNTKKGDE